MENADQTAFWNADPGRMWVRFQPDMDLLLEAVTGLLLEEAATRPGGRVLDVGCGAGATSLAFAGAVGPGGRVLGLDVSAPLLARARERAAGLGQLTFAEADAQVAELEAGRFDLVVSRFGVMFFGDPVAAFRNLGRALAPGGRMVLAAWAGVEANPFFRDPGRIGVARLGALPPSDPDGPGPMAFRDNDRVTGILRAAGLEAVEGRAVDLALVHPGGIEPVLDMLTGIGGLPRLMRERGGTAEDMAAIQTALRDAWAAHVGPEGLRLPARVNLFSARAG